MRNIYYKLIIYKRFVFFFNIENVYERLKMKNIIHNITK